MNNLTNSRNIQPTNTMIPINTVPITAEELLPLKEQGIDLLVHNRFCNVWSVTHLSDLDINLPEFKRIAAHDYRHYFGEVVDLSKKETLISGVKWRLEYLDHMFEVHRYSWECKVYKDYENETTPLVSGTQPQCQQWLCDYFTELFKKDLPHLNIKFVWS